jgi:hypothetical protein
MESPFFGAFLRALTIGLLSGASTFLAAWSTTDDAKALGIATATAFLAPFLVRSGGKGFMTLTVMPKFQKVSVP